MIGRCRLVVIEGTHGTGKTTLAHALLARLKRAHQHAAYAGEAARESPFLEAVVVHGRGDMDVSAELHIFASQIAREQLLSRHAGLLVCDKSAVNVLAYARLVLPGANAATERILAAMARFCGAYVPLYDAAFLVSDRHDMGRTDDPFRPRDERLRDAVETELLRISDEVGLRLERVPVGLRLEDQVEWVLGCLRGRGLLVDAER